MSQSGMLTVADSVLPPDVPTSFTTNSGVAVPAANNLNVFGSVVAAGSNPFRSIGSGSTVTYQAQISQAIASTDATKIGLSAFDSSQFSVDANGFVSILNTVDLHTARFIVASSTAGTGANYTTIASAIAAAQATGINSTVFIQPGTYTENLSMVAGVNLCAYNCDALTPNVTIVGTLTMTTAGSVSISGIRLQTNSAALLAVTGSAASIVNLTDCFLNCTNNTGITFSSSNSSAAIGIFKCKGNIGTTGISLFTHTSAGSIDIRYSQFANTGGATTSSTVSAGNLSSSFSTFQFPLTMSGTGAVSYQYCSISNSGLNTTMLTLGASGIQNFKWCRIESGSASAVSIGAIAIMDFCDVNSTNTNAITGGGQLFYAFIVFAGSSSGVNTTTVTPLATLI